MTHDSVAVGEDGPTHEPIEQLASVRSMPNLNVIRPADGNETNAAWKRALAETERPTMLVLTRQNLPESLTVQLKMLKLVSIKGLTSSQKLKVILMVSSLRLVLK